MPVKLAGSNCTIGDYISVPSQNCTYTQAHGQVRADFKAFTGLSVRGLKA